MADSGNNGTNSERGGSGRPGSAGGTTGGQPAGGSVLSFMMTNKVESALWLTRLFTVICTLLFFLPIIGGSPYGFYQRAFISNAATSALRLHQRLPNFQFNRQFLSLLLAEDSCHYLVFSILFMNSYPLSMALIPVFLYALLHACNYTVQILNVMGPASMQFVRNMIIKLQAQQVGILRFIACTEIFIMPAVFLMTFTGRCTIFLPVIYYRFLLLRYSSRRNPYCRTLFHEMRLTIEYLCNKPQCPAMIRNMLTKAIAVISRLAPTVA